MKEGMKEENPKNIRDLPLLLFLLGYEKYNSYGTKYITWFCMTNILILIYFNQLAGIQNNMLKAHVCS